MEAATTTTSQKRITKQNLNTGSPDKTGQQQDDPPESKSEPPSKQTTTSQSAKSNSGSSRHPSRKYFRSRALKRKFKVREFQEKDLKYFYASYRLQGGEPMSADDYAQLFVNITEKAQMLWVVTEPYNGDDRPVGAAHQTGNGQTWETHVWWLDWATPRDKLVAALTFILKKRDEQTIMITSNSENDRFFEQLARYGVLRRVGTISRFWPDGENAYIWQSRRAGKVDLVKYRGVK